MFMNWSLCPRQNQYKWAEVCQNEFPIFQTHWLSTRWLSKVCLNEQLLSSHVSHMSTSCHGYCNESSYSHWLLWWLFSWLSVHQSAFSGLWYYTNMIIGATTQAKRIKNHSEIITQWRLGRGGGWLKHHVGIVPRFCKSSDTCTWICQNNAIGVSWGAPVACGATSPMMSPLTSMTSPLVMSPHNNDCADCLHKMDHTCFTRTKFYILLLALVQPNWDWAINKTWKKFWMRKKIPTIPWKRNWCMFIKRDKTNLFKAVTLKDDVQNNL